MSHYSYNARDASGQLVRGTMEAASELDLSAKLSQLGYFLVQVRQTAAQQNALVSGAPRLKLKRKEVLAFTISIATLLKSGIPLLEGLVMLSEDIEHPRTRALLRDLIKRLEAGSTFRNALAAHPGSFDELYCALVQVGETTGKLDTLLNNLVGILEWQLELRARMLEVLTYPAILCVVMIGVVSLLVVKIIPMFASLLTSFGVSLPLPTRVVLAVGGLGSTHWYLPLAIAGLTALTVQLARRSERGRLVLDSWKLRTPLFGSLLHKIALSRVCRTLSLCLSAGVNIVDSMTLSVDAAGNARIGSALRSAIDKIRVGQELRAALAYTGLFPPLVLHMVAIGERSGMLSQCVEKVTQFYDREIPATIKTLLTLFEPIMILFLGAIVGGIALALFLPLFQLSRSIGGG